MKANEAILGYLKSQVGKKIADGNPHPIALWMDGILLDASVGKLKAQFEVREDQINHAGIMHGGFVSTLLDEVMGMTMITVDIDFMYVTVNLYVDFLYGAKAGETVIVESEIIKVGKKIANIEGKLYHSSGKLLAKATCNMAATSIPIKN